MRFHITEKHPLTINCSLCEESFQENWKFEIHMKSHDQEKHFKCNRCEKEFYSSWRLKQHAKSHNVQSIKFCHFYNNGKMCPFEDLGCKFRHEWSDVCRFQSRCKNKMCQYQHQNNEKEKSEWKCPELNFMDENCKFKTTVNSRFLNHIKANHDIGKCYSCDCCELKTENRTDLIEHIKNIHKKNI